MSIHYHQINSLLLMIANPWGSKVQVNKMPQTNQVDQVQLVQCVHHVLQVGHGHHCWFRLSGIGQIWSGYSGALQYIAAKSINIIK